MANFIGNILSAFTDSEVREADRGDLMQTLVITALLAGAAILVIGWFATSMINKGADMVECIEGSNSFTQTDVDKVCDEDKTRENSVQTNDESGWGTRFGGGGEG